MNVGIPKETRAREARVAATPATVKKLRQKGFGVLVERSAGLAAGLPDAEYAAAGAQVVDTDAAFAQDVVLKVLPPDTGETELMKKGSLLLSFLEPFAPEDAPARLARAGIDAIALELVPRISRAQSMDALSSQANIAGYRAVVEAASRYRRFFPMMMTSAGSAKPAKVTVLGVGVAGLQAIGTARRLGASVQAYDVRPETREQVLSLGAKFIDIDVGEAGAGGGGYARELSEETQRRQRELLAERIRASDVVITTAHVPGRRAPVLVEEGVVRGMRHGSVIIDMAAANGGNCPLSEPDRVIEKHGVTIVGETNFPALVPTDASQFYANNLWNLMALLAQGGNGATASAAPSQAARIAMDLTDEIIAGALAVYRGEVRCRPR